MRTPYGSSSLVTVAVAMVCSRSSLIRPSLIADRLRRHSGGCRSLQLILAWRLGVGGRLAVGWFLPRGDQPQLPGDDLQGARDRDGNQRRHEAAEEAAEPAADRRSDQDRQQ